VTITDADRANPRLTPAANVGATLFRCPYDPAASCGVGYEVPDTIPDRARVIGYARQHLANDHPPAADPHKPPA
jgi:hypothetical protein